MQELCGLSGSDFKNVDMGDEETLPIPPTAIHTQSKDSAPPRAKDTTSVLKEGTAHVQSHVANVAREEIVLTSNDNHGLPEESGAEALRQLYRLERCVIEGAGEDIVEDIMCGLLPESCAMRAASTARSFLRGDYADVLMNSLLFAEHPCTNASSFDDVEALIISRVQRYCRSSEQTHADDVWKVAEVMWVGAAALHIFLQSNYTGPELSASKVDEVGIWLAAQLGLSSGSSSDACNSTATSYLSVDGELPYFKSTLPSCLLLARIIFAVLADPVHALWTVPVIANESSDSNTDDKHTSIDNRDSTSRNRKIAARSGRRQRRTEEVSIPGADKLSTASWWCARACVAHSRLILEMDRSETLWAEACDLFQNVIATFGNVNIVNKTDSTMHRYLCARAWLEWGLAQHYFEDPSKGKHSFAKAQEVSGLIAQWTGALGKRTKYQQKELAQSVLLAKSAEPLIEKTEEGLGKENIGVGTNQVLSVPELGQNVATSAQLAEMNALPGAPVPEIAVMRTVQHDKDSHLLEGISFKDSELEQPSALQHVDLCIILALCLDVANFNPRDGLTNDQMSPYVDRVLRVPSNWMIYSTALLQRAWIEFERNHLAERSALQLQALLDQHTTRLTFTQSTEQSVQESAKVQERLAHIHSITYPPRWELQRDLAQRYAKVGVFGSAAELFTELEMWDEVVECYSALQLPGRAETVVKERLAINETPQMLCALGEIKHDPELFERAWVLSGNRYARAKTSLGRYWFSKGDYEASAIHFKAAVTAKPNLPRAWFTYGSVLMRLSRWEEALQAYSRVVQQCPDDGEAWANCGAIHLRMGNWDRARSALTEGLKQNRTSWRMWDNQLTALLHLQRWDEAVYALNTWLDLKDKHQQPPDIVPLRLLADAAVESMAGITGEDRTLSPLAKSVAELLGRVTASTKSDAALWDVYASFNERLDRGIERVVECREKQCRALQAVAGWEKISTSVDELGCAAEQLTQAYISQGTKQALYTCKMFLKSAVRKIEVAECCIGCEGHAKLKTLLESIEQHGK